MNKNSSVCADMSTMADENIILFLGYRLLIKKKKKINRKMWVHPLVSSRPSEGALTLIFEGLRSDPDKFFNFFRMSVSAFDELLSTYLGEKLLKIDTNMRKAISPAEKLAVTLRYLGTGCTFQDLHYFFKLGASTIGNIVREVCNVVWEELAHIQMPPMTEDIWKDTAAKFEQHDNFPHCLGAIDGKHIRSFGKDSDSTIFKNSTFWNLLQKNELNIPESCPILNTNINADYVFVADEAFGLFQHVLRPYGEDVNTTSHRGTRSANDMRNTFADYFSSVGAVPWQHDI
ncbi:uncharacterized protein LOC132934786 [Metopolophium dirhodum]|uniref:uncharacterized protein LOC132934786 n=1 Tax=Metopolophium dirhodum TaxID=44670 RepID=UPI00299076FC|nr:uncharacterized protein LOC132934786 [Metopolophium dirhodum]